MNGKRFGIFCLALLALLPLGAQNMFTSGTYMAEEDPMEFGSIIAFYDITPTEIRQMSYSEGALYYTMDQSNFSDEEGVSYQRESSAFMKNNAISYWINTCKECGWTETQVASFFYIGSPWIYYYTHNRFVNNISADESFNYTFTDDGKSFTSENEGYLRLIPNLILAGDDLTIGAKSSSYISIHEVRITNQTTEITLKVTSPQDNYGCFLTSPGSADAFVLQDNDGNSYQLLGSFGWPAANGYGSISLDEGDELFFILFFEPMPAEAGRFNLKEGDCSSGCWNFYDIRYSVE